MVEGGTSDATGLGSTSPRILKGCKKRREASSTPRGVAGFSDPYPVVSLRSTTGYWLPSLRLGLFCTMGWDRRSAEEKNQAVEVINRWLMHGEGEWRA